MCLATFYTYDTRAVTPKLYRIQILRDMRGQEMRRPFNGRLIASETTWEDTSQLNFITLYPRDRS